MPEHQPLPPGGRLAVLAGDDLAVGPADADRETVDQDVSLLGAGLLDVGHRGRAGLLGNDGQCSHRSARLSWRFAMGCYSAAGVKKAVW